MIVSDFCTLYPGITFSADTVIRIGPPTSWSPDMYEDMMEIARLNRLYQDKCDDLPEGVVVLNINPSAVELPEPMEDGFHI